MISPPTSLLGNQLSKEFIDFYCLKDTWKILKKYFTTAEMKDSLGSPKYSPRLEAILENIIEINGIDCLQLMKSVYITSPNQNHFFFASHLLNGGTHVTTNFDDCIQKSLLNFNEKELINTISTGKKSQKVPTNIDRSIYHIHGKFSPSINELNELGLRISKIAKGILYPFNELIKKNSTKKRIFNFFWVQRK